ncbi:MAG: UDP-N-acetylmuramoyl-L-alanine--D-glutamate ligase [Rhodospirillaceae bacterium]|nr:UDP-N-acetylmuramoyl-L-alanine--D-glutamate ligase [Rhodospirillaceae bacterium]
MIDVTSFANKPVGVLGLGRSGLSAVRALAAGGAEVWAWDDQAASRDKAIEEGVELTDLYQSDWSQLNTLVLSPGIPDQYPKPHEIATRARAAGCEIICDVDLLAREVSAARFVGVSGTNGKSTTTALIGHILKAAGRSVEIGGNYGIPALDLAPLGEDGTYVLELSSYQLERIPSVRLDVAVLLNISPDHLDRHGGLDGYVAAKRILFERSKENAQTIIGMEDSHCRGISLELMIDRGGKGIVPISGSARTPGGVYVENGMLIDDLENQQQSIMDLRVVPTLPGQHNWQNTAAAYAAARAADIEPETIAAAIKSFSGLAHRQELIREFNGVAYINDSKATNTEAAAKALGCYENVHWIAGGQFKEEDLGTIEEVMPQVKQVYLIGEAQDQLAGLLGSSVSTSTCGDLETAVKAAHQAAQSEGGGTVLLSPACASFDQFSDFEQRGETFRDLVNYLEAGTA